MALIAQPPLPAPPVLTPPAGWLGHLGIKSGGKQPGQVSPYLQPTQDMLQFYLAGGRQPLFAGAAFANVNNNASVSGCVVPTQTLWLVESMHAQTAGPLGAAANVLAQIMVRDPALNVIFGSPWSSRAALTGEVLRLDFQPQQPPLILLPGYLVDILSSAAAAPTAFNWILTVFGQSVLA